MLETRRKDERRISHRDTEYNKKTNFKKLLLLFVPLCEELCFSLFQSSIDNIKSSILS